MSWGKRIAILYIGFVLLIAGLIWRSSMENTDLVSADYYDRELHFQEQIDGAEALNRTGLKPTVVCMNDKIVLDLPEGLSQSPQGTLVFYRPDNAKLDQTFPLTASHAEFEKAKFAAGNYNIRLQWSSAGQKYFFETTLYIP